MVSQGSNKCIYLIFIYKWPCLFSLKRRALALMSFGGDTQRATTVLQQLVAMDPAGNHDQPPPADCSWEFYFR